MKVEIRTMIGNFDDEAQNILNNAKIEMNNLGHPYVGTEHLLLSILNSDNDIVNKLNEKGVYVSMQSACSLGTSPSKSVYALTKSKERASNSYPLSVVSTTSKPNFFANDWSESQFFCFLAPSIQMPDLPFSLASVIHYSINELPYPFPLGLPKTHKQYR